jgi:hypothetical protein
MAEVKHQDSKVKRLIGRLFGDLEWVVYLRLTVLLVYGIKFDKFVVSTSVLKNSRL